jgi:hypothetical protein
MSIGRFPYLQYDPIAHLMASRRPAWVRYRTAVDVLGGDPDDPAIASLREKRDTSAAVRRIRAKQSPDGSFLSMPWRHTHKYDFFQLVQMGYGLEDETVRRAVDSLLADQLPGGGFNSDRRTAKGREWPNENRPGNWTPCMTAFVTHTFLDLGMEHDEAVGRLLELLTGSQREGGGWICNRGARSHPYCIYGGTGWSFAVLTRTGDIRADSEGLKGLLGILEKHKEKIARHGYQRDLACRCDAALLLPALRRVGLTLDDRLCGDLYWSLVRRQQPDGSWAFAGKTAAWYTLEVVKALQTVNSAS